MIPATPNKHVERAVAAVFGLRRFDAQDHARQSRLGQPARGGLTENAHAGVAAFAGDQQNAPSAFDPGAMNECGKRAVGLRLRHAVQVYAAVKLHPAPTKSLCGATIKIARLQSGVSARTQGDAG